MGSERAPELAEVIRRAIDAQLAHVYVSMPARVERYDSTTQKVDAKPLIMSFYRDEEDNRKAESFPVVTNVPVEFPQGGGYCLTFPLVPGDIGKLTFSQHSLDAWLAGQGQEVDPGIDHLHSLTDGMFYPGMRPFGSPLAGVPADHAALGATNGVRLHMHGGYICIGDESGSDYIALAAKVESELSSIATGLTACGYLGYSPGSVGASQAKAK